MLFTALITLATLQVAQGAQVGSKEIAKAEKVLVEKFGAAQKPRIDRGLKQTASLWRKADGDFVGFVTQNFIVDEKALDALMARCEQNFEQLDGHTLEIGRELRKAQELDVGEPLPVDSMFSSYDASAHITEDLFRSKVGFVVLLNFRLSTLAERDKESATWTRKQWAEARLTGRFARRVPAEVQQAITEANSNASVYVDDYNIYMHHVLNDKKERLFEKGKRLISHWNLRDELKANYADARGIDKQRAIVKIMERIVTQTIPASVINNPAVDWNPFTNAVTVAPNETVEEGGSKSSEASQAPEPDTRYKIFLANYLASRAADPYSPTARTAIDRAFEVGAEMSEQRVRALLLAVLSSPMVGKVAKIIEQRLGRKLEAQDLWYNGFVARGEIPEAKLDAMTQKKYPDAAAFYGDMPRILRKLGFSETRAKYLTSRIRVDAARGAGHALQAARRGDFARLRTRIEKNGMNYKGYNIAVHEFGHNVEQTFSLYDVDHTLLAGVPNTAFTEALAFVFQAKDLELLGLSKPTEKSETLRVLNDFWMTYEIAGVGLIDIDVWKWMYAHPKATPKQLKDATVKIAQEVWSKYYAPLLGGQSSPMLGIYSHMISYPLYLFNYPLGHLIAFQIEEQIAKKGSIGPEFERMAKFGAVSPDAWMINATGQPVSAEPLLRATQNALDKLSKTGSK